MPSERKERETEWVRSQIVDAAARIFTQKGYHGATMDEIARTAGYSPAAIYRYYKNKEEVFRATIQAVGERFLATIDEEPPMALGFVDRLRWVMARQRQLAEERRDFFTTFMAQTMACDIETCANDEGPQRLHAQHLDRLAALMQRGIDEGALRPGEPLDYATAFASLGRGFFLRWLAAPEAGALEALGERILDLFLRGTGRDRGKDDPCATR